MANVKTRRIWVDPSASADVVEYNWYAGPENDPSFLGAVDAQAITPFDETADPEAFIVEGTLPEGTYQFAVTAEDGAGNTSDPFQAAGWVSVPLDVTPPLAPTNGGIE